MSLNVKRPSTIKQKNNLKYTHFKYVLVTFLYLKDKETISKAFKVEKKIIYMFILLIYIHIYTYIFVLISFYKETRVYKHNQ